MIYGLDLFSGIGGIALGLSEWVRPITYCEIDKYAQAVLISRMQDEWIPTAPIWNDIKTLKGIELEKQGLPKPEIITSGFPCQDISTAGHGQGLEGKRSGLFFEVMRLCREIRPQFLFLENVTAITLRGLDRVTAELSSMGYDCRWGMLGAKDVGAKHVRERWWLLANSMCGQCEYTSKVESRFDFKSLEEGEPIMLDLPPDFAQMDYDKNDTEHRMLNDVPYGLDRIKSLGNAVVPACAREAFRRLMGLKD